MKSDVYTTKGTKASAIELDEIVFGAPYNKDLVYQVVVAMQSNARQGSAHTKNRGEVRGGGIKPWRQKGTGRARHGSRRSPLWVGGGVTFGPRNDKDYSKKTNRKTKVKALYTVLSEKFRTTRIVLVDSAKLATISTKSVQDMINGLSKVTGFETLDTKKNPNNILIVTPSYDETLLKSIGNMPHVTMTDALSLNVLDVMTHRYMVISEPETVNAILASRHWDKETITPAGESTDGDTTAPKKKAVKKAVAKKAVTA